MHRGLHIPEVVELICAAAASSTLAALARTCQTFQPPALAVLWETQSELTNLLKCLPSDAWETYQSPPNSYIVGFRFRRPIAASDLTRLLFYAEKVKTLFIEHQVSFSWSVYAALSLALPVYPLLPNLRHLTILTWQPTEHAAPHIRMLVGHKLRSLVFNLQGGPELVPGHILPYLTAFHPELTSLHINPVVFGTQSTTAITESMYLTIRSMKHLQDLNVGTLDGPTISYLATLPHFHSLEVGIFPELLNDYKTKLAATEPAFPALRQFTTVSRSFPSICSFMEMIGSDVFTELTLSFDSEPSIETHSWQIFDTLISQRFSKSLKKFIIDEHNSFEHDIPDSLDRMIPKDAFHPLLACSHLEDVVIQTMHGILIDNDFVEKIAVAWPQLRQLNLSPMGQSVEYIPSVTMTGLVPLAEHCRYLTSLTIVFDATVLDAHAKEKPGAGIHSESLVELDVVESPISSPTAVASFLSAIFPNLRTITSRDGAIRNMAVEDWQDDVEKWHSVNDTIQVFVSARAQEHHLPTCPPAEL
ncbi:hypothetical protein R3P38DRAFT_3068838 [Favolaschia claudopus]|uniref:F-box domain-containing protein n=1 Tax=Favolaschia claudopus TaxID=2862362 RepID=A0AAW0A0Z8_9AGAR